MHTLSLRLCVMHSPASEREETTMTLAQQQPPLRPERAFHSGYCPECGSPTTFGLGDESCPACVVGDLIEQPERLHAVRVA